MDTACYAEAVIPPYYDSLNAKVIANGNTRGEAILRMRRALECFVVEGIKTNVRLQQRILTEEDFVRGRISTRFMERFQAPPVKAGIKFPVNPKTKSPVCGEQYGGFRPQDCPQGSPSSAHKEGLAVDRFDPFGAIDDWLLNDTEAQKAARQLGIYFKHPKHTVGWSHWTIRKPGSGNFFPKP